MDLEKRLLERFRIISDDAVIHGEITQLITTPDGALYIIDWDECGLGSRYQDLGFVYYALLERELGFEPFQAFMDGYGENKVEFSLVKDTAGLIALAYAGFYDFERRLELGRKLLLV
jgi:aminoglycoside phosphotransferase